MHAEWPLRFSVIQVLADLLAEDGYLLFNNHRHRAAPWLIFTYGLSPRRSWQRGRNLVMSKQEMCRVADHAALRITEMFHSTVMCEDLTRMLPDSWTWAIESLASRLRFFEPFSQNLIAVCRHRRCTPDTGSAAIAT